MKGYCEDCYYWAVNKPEQPNEYGLCRRYPPQYTSEYFSKFPETAKKCFCGEFKPITEKRG